MSLKAFIHNKLNTYSKSQKTYSNPNIDFDTLNKVSEELKSNGLNTRVNKFGSIFCELNGRDVALRYDSENKKWLKLLPHVDSNPKEYKAITDIIDEVIPKYSEGSQKTYSSMSTLEKCKAKLISEFNKLNVSDEDKADMKASVDAMTEDQFVEACRTELSQIDDSDSMVPTLNECLADLGKTGLQTYSWAWLFKTVGAAVISSLIGKIFNRAKFSISRDQDTYNATLEKFRKAKNVDEAEKYFNMLQKQLNKADNKDEVKEELNKAKKEQEDKHPESK